MGLSDVGVGIEHVVVGRRDVHVATYDRRLRAGGDHLPQRSEPGELVLVVLRVRLAAVRYVHRDHADPATRGGDRARLWAREARRAGESRPPRRPARRARGWRLHSRSPRRGPRRHSRGRASSSPSRSTKASSASLVSCRQTTSGRRSSSQGSSRGTRCLTELTFQVAIRTDPTVPAPPMPEGPEKSGPPHPCCRLHRILTRPSSAAHVDPRGCGTPITLGGSRCHEFS